MNLQILVDGDACPVKEEIYKVAFRRNAPVLIVSNSRFRIPDHPLIARLVVSEAFDAADDAIAARASDKTVVITGDILLAGRCLNKGAAVIAPNGKELTKDSIGPAIATRAILADLRAGANLSGAAGPAPFSRADRSRFLQSLEAALARMERTRA